MEWWQAILLGVVEGLTEFLPVSSTGHLVVAERLLGIPDTDATKAFAICIQAGAIAAVLGLYAGRLRRILAGLVGRDPAGARLALALVVAFLPAAVLGLALGKRIKALLFAPWPIVAAWAVGGVAILLVARSPRLRGPEPPGDASRPAGDASRPAGDASRPAGDASRPAGDASRPAGDASRPAGDASRPAGDASRPAGDASRPAGDASRPAGDASRPAGDAPAALDPTPRQALLIGLAQCLALWPGTSRSLVTILGAVLVGLPLAAAVEFSFVLGLLTLGAATAKDALEHGPALLHEVGATNLALGLVTACLSAALAVRWMVAWLRTRGLEVFGWWRLGAAALVAGLLLAGMME